MHWNQIRAKGSTFMAKALKVNTTLKVLDMSFNSMASGAGLRLAVQDTAEGNAPN